MKLFQSNRIKTGPAIKSVVTIVVLHYSLGIASNGLSAALSDPAAIATEAAPENSESTLKLAQLLTDNPALAQWSEINRVRAEYLIEVAPDMAAKASGETQEDIGATDWLEGHCSRAEARYNDLGTIQGLFRGHQENYSHLSQTSNELIACVIVKSWLQTPENYGTLPSALQPGGLTDDE